MPKSKKSPAKSEARTPGLLPVEFHQINALLHTTRSIARHEDTLCTLQHEIKQTGGVSPTLTRELILLLEELPSHEYLTDIEALQTSLLRSTKTTGKPPQARTTAKKALPRKTAAKKSAAKKRRQQ